MRRDAAAVRVISESEELVQGIEDPFLGASLYPAVDESSNLLDQQRVARASKLHLAGVRRWPILGWKRDLLARLGLRPPRHAVRAHPVPLHLGCQQLAPTEVAQNRAGLRAM